MKTYWKRMWLVSVFWVGVCATGWAQDSSTATAGDEKSLDPKLAKAQRKKKREQYKRVHQEALRKMLAGDLDAAETQMKAFQAVHDDAETAFMLALIAGQRGNTDAVSEQMQRAIEQGLDPGRFIAGPRNLLGSMGETDLYETLLRGHEHTVVHGPLVGNVTATGADIWVRTAGLAEVRVWVSETRSFEERTFFTAQTRIVTDYTAIVRLAGLKPDTPYYYAIQVNQSGAIAPVPRQHFHTAPIAGGPARFTVAFGEGRGSSRKRTRVVHDRVVSPDPSNAPRGQHL